MDAGVVKGSLIKRLSEAMLKMDELDNLLNSLTQMAVEVFGVTRVTIALLDEESGQYAVKASTQSEGEQFRDAQPWLKERQKIVSRRLMAELGLQMAPELKDDLNRRDTVVSLPLFAEDKLIGVLNLGAKDKPYTKEDLEAASEVAQLFACVLQQAVQYQSIREQRLHHQNILDNLVSGIVAVDPEHKITVFNRAAERILKVKADQALGKDVRILQANLADLLLDTLDKHKSYRREELYIMPQNQLIGVSTSQFFDAQGKLLGACMVFSSLSEIKKQEKMLRQENLNAYWSNVATSVAHEVKNSIMAAKVYAEMFPQKYDDAEFRWNLYAALKRDMEKLDRFSETLLNFAQTQELVIQSCELDKVVDAAINQALQDRDLGAISFEKRYSPTVQPIPADYHQLKEAFACIISNALETMGKEGRLSISVEQEADPQMLAYSLPGAERELPKGDVVVIKISDTGSGILPQDLPYLFDPFFTRKEARPGLGLCTARKIVERHGGMISVESKAGEGSTFWICLPNEAQASEVK